MNPTEKAINETHASKRVSSNEYTYIHNFLRKTLGKASKCSNPECSRKSKTYHWALIKGKEYEYEIENFMELCASCHILYDFTEETREKFRKAKLGRKLSDETKSKMSESHKGNKPNDEAIRKMSLAKTGKKMSDEVRKNMSLAHMGKPVPWSYRAVINNKGEVFPSITSVYSKYPKNNRDLKLALNGKKDTCFGLTWKYVDSK